MKLREVLRSSLKVMTIGVIAGLAASKSLADKNSKTFFYGQVTPNTRGG